MEYGKEIAKVLITEAEARKRIAELADQINRDYEGKEYTVVVTLRGAVMFFADLFRQLTGNVDCDFIAVSSYGATTSTTGEVKMSKDLSSPIKGKHIIIVEDIIDTGITLSYLKKMFSAREPASLKVCSFLDKPSRREVEIEGDYIGFTIPNEFVVGYGLDYDQKLRNLPDVCVLAPEVYGG
ncbi:MAG: hypoxanthine phosphoribosyltransferase [Clostridia bacterium]|nr:hypoxanthine phosphoribosyltransferase [Clostridia bacterium]